MTDVPARVALTPEAADLLRRLRAVHGPLMFHQSGGCCDGSSPMCYPDGDFKIGGVDVHLGDLQVEGIEPVSFWMSQSQFEYWKHTHLTIDVVEGPGQRVLGRGTGGRAFPHPITPVHRCRVRDTQRIVTRAGQQKCHSTPRWGNWFGLGDQPTPLADPHHDRLPEHYTRV
jgi:uncharacterized protein (DUF779 family)